MLPRAEVSLTDALSLALRHNPELGASMWEMRARESEVQQAGIAPNPELALEVENFAGTGELGGLDAAETTLGLSQLLELGGKRAKRWRVADHDRYLAAWDFETRRLDLITEVTGAFVSVLAAQERVELVENLIAISEQTLESVARRVRAGSLSPVEEARAGIELATSRVEKDQALRQLAIARRQLASTWGESSAQFTEVVGELDVPPRVPIRQILVDSIVQNPDLARWDTELDRQRAALALERSLRVPDVTVGGGLRWVQETDDAALVLEVGLPLPIIDRNQGAILAAERRIAVSSEQQRAAQFRIQAALATTYEELAGAAKEAVTLRDQVLPEAASASETAQHAYTQGLFTLTDVLDTQRTLFELRSRYVTSLTRYHFAAAEIERITGRSFEELLKAGEEADRS
jgi:cobalt-zinc-cadmium efflux system outer membrane protein